MTQFPIDVGDGRQLWGPQSDGTFLISDGGGWIPGVYADRETAMLAFNVDTVALYWIQETVNKANADPVMRVITADMLRSSHDHGSVSHALHHRAVRTHSSVHWSDPR